MLNIHSTYKFACIGLDKEEADAYVSENTLVRILDKNTDEKTHLPIERCYGKVVTGELKSILVETIANCKIFFFCFNSVSLDSQELRKIKRTKCPFDGVIYKKGERITPDGTCYECICDERLKTQDLDIFKPQCQRKLCGLGAGGEEHEYLNLGCVPVYDKTKTTCCPIEWRCRKYHELLFFNQKQKTGTNDLNKISSFLFIFYFVRAI